MEINIDELTIRLVTPQDRDRVERFFASLGEEGTGFLNRGRGNEKTALAYCDGEKPNSLYWAAVHQTEDGEEFVGLTFIWDKDPMIPWFGIGVSEAWKGHHLGRRLIAAVREHCEAAGCGGILLTTAQNNFRGQGLYEHCGFEKLGVHTSGEFQYLLRFPIRK